MQGLPPTRQARVTKAILLARPPPPSTHSSPQPPRAGVLTLRPRPPPTPTPSAGHWTRSVPTCLGGHLWPHSSSLASEPGSRPRPYLAPGGQSQHSGPSRPRLPQAAPAKDWLTRELCPPSARGAGVGVNEVEAISSPPRLPPFPSTVRPLGARSSARRPALRLPVARDSGVLLPRART